MSVSFELYFNTYFLRHKSKTILQKKNLTLAATVRVPKKPDTSSTDIMCHQFHSDYSESSTIIQILSANYILGLSLAFVCRLATCLFACIQGEHQNYFIATEVFLFELNEFNILIRGSHTQKKTFIIVTFCQHFNL